MPDMIIIHIYINYNEGFHNVKQILLPESVPYSLSVNIMTNICIIISIKTRSERYIARMGEAGGQYEILITNPEWNSPLEDISVDGRIKRCMLNN
jgi:hypothetical protein